MNNNNNYKPVSKGNKNCLKLIEHKFEQIQNVQQYKKSQFQNLLLFQDPYVFKYHYDFNSNSVDMGSINMKSEPNQDENTELIRNKFQLQNQRQRSNCHTAYFPKLRLRAQSNQKQQKEKIALKYDLDSSPINIKQLQRSFDYSLNQKNKQKKLQIIQQRTMESSQQNRKQNYFNKKENWQFSLELQSNGIRIEKQKLQFPKEFFLGNVRNIKRQFQQQ